MSIKQPVFAYSHERLLKGMVSAIGFACLIRLSQIGEGESVLLELMGMVSFVALIDWIAQLRIKRILELNKGIDFPCLQYSITFREALVLHYSAPQKMH